MTLFSACKKCFSTLWNVVTEEGTGKQWLVCNGCGTVLSNSSHWPELKDGYNKQAVISA